MVAGFSSCNKDKKVDIAYAVNVEVNPYGVISGFTEYYDGDFDLSPGDYVRIKVFAYDENGKLVGKQVSKCSAYSKVANLSFNLPEGKYTFVASSDIYTPSIDFEYWGTSMEDDISTLQIDYVAKKVGYDDSMLGLKMCTKEVKGACSVDISLLPATAMLRFHFRNIHYWSDVTLYRFVVINKPDRVKVDGDSFSYSCSATGYYDFITYINPLDEDNTGNNYYQYSCILPVKNIDYCGFAYVDENYLTYVPFGDGTASFVSGKMYDIYYDIKNLEISIQEGEKAVCNPSDETKIGQSAKIIDLVANNPILNDK